MRIIDADTVVTIQVFDEMYEEYKSNHEQKNNEQFFNHHKDDECSMHYPRIS